ncbi:epoxide hydrolase 3-like [Leptopilina boulardi]|uniref:epoxide hydrolase 3-like n=1 Tax=Leptopilina boulardi TaxID=63433 RepID=UPI0021F523CA|nr:epoxide hydrolase 3-like [Leptopilina boulardi]
MNVKVVHVSLLEIVKLHFLSFTYGLYLIVKRLLQWAWNPKNFFLLQRRDKPPQCLVDNSLGEHLYVKLKGVKFHYVETGDKDKPVLLLLHGFPDCWLSWREQLPVLSMHYRVVALDLKGFGDSDKPPKRSSYKIEILLDELEQFIFSLGVKNCSIIGHDLGGLLGWYFVALHENMVHKFVAISSPHPNIYWNGIPGETALGIKWIHFSRLPFLPEIDALKEDLSIINDTFSHLQLKETNEEKNYVEAYKYAFSRKEDWTGPLNYYRNLPYIRLSPHSMEPINIQTLLLIGNLDPLVSLASVIQSSEYIEKVNVKLVPGAHHFPHQEKPEFVNEAIIKFLFGTHQITMETLRSKSIMSSMLNSLSTTMKFGNQVFSAVQNVGFKQGK